MTRPDLRPFYGVLELPDGAPLSDVQNAYLRLRKIYAGTSDALAPLEEEFPENKRREILVQVEEAYAALRAALSGSRAEADGVESVVPSPETEPVENTLFDGPGIRKIRERRSLDETAVSRELKIRRELLRALEEERYADLPQEVYLKAHLQNIARLLGLPPEQAAEDYLRRYRDWREKRRGEED